MKFSRHINLANFPIQKNREIKVTRTISVANITWRWNYVSNQLQERTNLLALKRLNKGNKVCSSWKGSITARCPLSGHLHGWLLRLAFMFLNCTVTKRHDIFLRSQSVARNFQCKWMSWSVNSRTTINAQAWTALLLLLATHKHELLCCYCWHLVSLLRFSS